MHVQYDQLHQASARLAAGQEELDATIGKLRALVTDLVSQGFRTERASHAFDEATGNFAQGAHQAVAGLEGLARFLTHTGETLRQTDSELAQRVNAII